jgi:hypothetical protein
MERKRQRLESAFRHPPPRRPSRPVPLLRGAKLGRPIERPGAHLQVGSPLCFSARSHAFMNEHSCAFGWPLPAFAQGWGGRFGLPLAAVIWCFPSAHHSLQGFT